jgi:hypothetical protein
MGHPTPSLGKILGGCFFSESRTRGTGWRSVQEIRVSIVDQKKVGADFKGETNCLARFVANNRSNVAKSLVKSSTV